MAAFVRSGVAVPSFLILAVTEIVFPVLALIVGLIAGWFAYAIVTGNSLRRAKMDADQIRATAGTEAEASKQKIELEAEKRARERREELDREIAEARADIKKDQQRLAKREDTLDQKLESISERESRMDRKENDLRSLEESLTKDREQLEQDQQQVKARLQELSGMTPDQAREQFMEEVRRESEHDGNRLSQKIIEEAETEARRRSREITINAIQRYASEHVADSTVRSVRIPSDDLKGRIIGREGRNIRAFEQTTGIDVIIDDTPEAVVLSGFDPVRREVARIAMEKLIEDGRIHPGRIEEVVEKSRGEVEESMQEAAEQALYDLGIHQVHPAIVKALGRLRFRTSYGQNQLLHSKEVARLAGAMAAEMGLDVQMAKRAGLLHDVGKGLTHDQEGTHVELGYELCQKHGEPEIVLNSIRAHHDEEPHHTAEAFLVTAADAISGSRPGARREMFETYVKRLERLEKIATDFPGVERCFAVQAGREVRVMVEPEEVSDQEMVQISEKVARRFEEELQYPGQIKVVVIRETRAVDFAR